MTRYPYRPSTLPIVYVRPVSLADLPAEIRANLPPAPHFYAVHDEDGARMAIVTDRALAFVMARQNEYEPVSVH
jgi:hypothetical protein